MAQMAPFVTLGAAPPGMPAGPPLRSRPTRSWPSDPGSMSHPQHNRVDLAPQIERFAALWSLPAIAETASVRFSTRLRRAWGRANLDRRTVTLAAVLEDDPSLLESVLCHELAHIAAYILVGRSERSHGVTWQRLVTEAGYRPSPRLSDGAAAHPAQRTRRHYLHRCPVCGFSRRAGKPMTTWRCADCVAAGLEGDLVITEEQRAGE